VHDSPAWPNKGLYGNQVGRTARPQTPMDLHRTLWYVGSSHFRVARTRRATPTAISFASFDPLAVFSIRALPSTSCHFCICLFRSTWHMENNLPIDILQGNATLNGLAQPTKCIPNSASYRPPDLEKARSLTTSSHTRA